MVRIVSSSPTELQLFLLDSVIELSHEALRDVNLPFLKLFNYFFFAKRSIAAALTPEFYPKPKPLLPHQHMPHHVRLAAPHHLLSAIEPVLEQLEAMFGRHLGIIREFHDDAFAAEVDQPATGQQEEEPEVLIKSIRIALQFTTVTGGETLLLAVFDAVMLVHE